MAVAAVAGVALEGSITLSVAVRGPLSTGSDVLLFERLVLVGVGLLIPGEDDAHWWLVRHLLW